MVLFYHLVSSTVRRLVIYNPPSFMTLSLKSIPVISHHQKKAGPMIIWASNGLKYLTNILRKKLAITSEFYGLIVMGVILVLTSSYGLSSIESIL